MQLERADKQVICDLFVSNRSCFFFNRAIISRVCVSSEKRLLASLGVILSFRGGVNEFMVLLGCSQKGQDLALSYAPACPYVNMYRQCSVKLDTGEFYENLLRKSKLKKN